MKRNRKKGATPSAEEMSLALPGVDGATAETYPGPVVDNMRQMITRMQRKGEFPARLGVVAALQGEGVTTVARALAATMAHDLGGRVCLVDLNWWRPAGSPLVAPDNGGLAAVLTGEAALDDVLAPTGWSNLAYLPAGTVAYHDRPVMARSQALRDVMTQLDRRFDHLVLDVPAILATGDSVALASLATAAVLVICQGTTNFVDVQAALDEIDHLPVVGTVLNRVVLKTPRALLKLVPSV